MGDEVGIVDCKALDPRARTEEEVHGLGEPRHIGEHERMLAENCVLRLADDSIEPQARGDRQQPAHEEPRVRPFCSVHYAVHCTQAVLPPVGSHGEANRGHDEVIVKRTLALWIVRQRGHTQGTEQSAFRERMVDAVDVSGLSALAWAASTPLGSQSVESMKLLYEFGARDDTFTIDGRALLHVAATGKNAHALAFLIDIKQHPVDMLSLNKEHTPLFIASFHGSNACAKALLRRGANINAAAFNGATPLIAAASGVQKGVAKLLLKEGANALAMLNDGKFPSQVVPKTPNGRMLKFFLSRAERKARRKREKYNTDLNAQEPPPPERDDIIDESLVEDLEADRVSKGNLRSNGPEL